MGWGGSDSGDTAATLTMQCLGEVLRPTLGPSSPPLSGTDTTQSWSKVVHLTVYHLHIHP